MVLPLTWSQCIVVFPRPRGAIAMPRGTLALPPQNDLTFPIAPVEMLPTNDDCSSQGSVMSIVFSISMTVFTVKSLSSQQLQLPPPCSDWNIRNCMNSLTSNEGDSVTVRTDPGAANQKEKLNTFALLHNI